MNKVGSMSTSSWRNGDVYSSDFPSSEAIQCSGHSWFIKVGLFESRSVTKLRKLFAKPCANGRVAVHTNVRSEPAKHSIICNMKTVEKVDLKDERAEIRQRWRTSEIRRNAAATSFWPNFSGNDRRADSSCGNNSLA